MQHRPTITTALALTIVAACTAAFGSSSAARAAGHGPRCDSGTIVFSRFDQNGIPNLFATNPCGGAVAQITTAGGHHPDISQDGRLLAYDSIDAGQSTTDVFLSSSRRHQAAEHHELAGDERHPARPFSRREVDRLLLRYRRRTQRTNRRPRSPLRGSTRDYAGRPRTGSVRPELVAFGSLDRIRHVQRHCRVELPVGRPLGRDGPPADHRRRRGRMPA